MSTHLLLLAALAASAPTKPKVDLQLPPPGTPGVVVKDPVSPFPHPMASVEGEAARLKIQAEKGSIELSDAIKRQTQQIGSALSDRFSVVFLNTTDPALKDYIAQGLLRINGDIYTHMEAGLASLYVPNGRVNGKRQGVCYILNNPQHALHLWRSFLPEDDKSPTAVEWGATYLVAHELGHCLDLMQRQAYTTQGRFTAQTLLPLGVPQVAFDRTFGPGRTIDAREYQAQQVVLNRDGAQMQYQERVADAFAVLWMMGHKAPNANLKPIWDTRMRVAANGVHHAHATLPALQKAYAFGMDLKATPSVQSLWDMARTAQAQAGVDTSLSTSSALVHDDAEDREKAPGAKPGQINPQTGQLPATVRFDRLPKFGQ